MRKEKPESEAEPARRRREPRTPPHILRQEEERLKNQSRNRKQRRAELSRRARNSCGTGDEPVQDTIPDLLASHALTVEEFCARNNMVSSTYYKLRKAGLGPAEMTFGMWVRISPEAEQDWRRMMSERKDPDQNRRLRARHASAAAMEKRKQTVGAY